MSTAALAALAEKLEDKKYTFLNELRSSVKSHVAAKKTQDCLIVVTKSTSHPTASGVSWYWNDGLPYVSRLISFLQKKNHVENGTTYSVDSILTEEIAAIVANSFTTFYTQESEVIAEYAAAHILENQKIANGLIKSLVEGSQITRYASKRVKRQLMDTLMGGMLSQVEQIQGQIGHSIVMGTSKATAAIASSHLAGAVGQAASSAIGKVVMRKIAIYVSHNIGAVAAKLMAVPVIKALVMKFAAAAIIGAFVKFIAVKAGIGIGAAVAFVLLPILIGVFAHEWNSFPEKLGESIAESICAELDDNFVEMNTQTLDNVFQQLLEDQVEAIGKYLADDYEVAEQIGEVLNLIHA